MANMCVYQLEKQMYTLKNKKQSEDLGTIVGLINVEHDVEIEFINHCIANINVRVCDSSML